MLPLPMCSSLAPRPASMLLSTPLHMPSYELQSATSAIGDRGQRHGGLGAAPPPGQAAADPYDAFRNRRSNAYKEVVEISRSRQYSNA